MTKFYVDNWITALRGSVVRRVSLYSVQSMANIRMRLISDSSNTLLFSESSRPYQLHSLSYFFLWNSLMRFAVLGECNGCGLQGAVGFVGRVSS